MNVSGVLNSILAGILVSILITLLYLGMHMSQGRVEIVNVKDLFLGIGLMTASLGFVGILIRVKGTLGWIPLALSIFVLIVLFLLGLFLISTNIV